MLLCFKLSLLKNILVFFIVILSIKDVQCANIFCIFPSASFSHQQPMLALSRSLANKGHNLTVITPNPSKVPIKNVREIDISFMYDMLNEIQKKRAFLLQTPRSSYSLITELPDVLEVMATAILSSSNIQDLIQELKTNNTKYDLIMIESFFYSSLLGFADILGNPPAIGITTAHLQTKLSSEMGNPIIPSYIPNVMIGYDDDMSLLERFENLCVTLYFQFVIDIYNTPKQETIMRKFFGDVKYSAREMEHNKSLLITSSDLASGYATPVNPNTIHVGPLHIETPKALPADIKSWMDGAEDGVIYFSLGSNMKGTSVPAEKRSAFIKTFTQFPKMRVLWKWEADELPGKPANVLIKKWIPQQSVLAHPKIKLFITQAGLQSLQEAIYCEVPILCMPLYADQHRNARVTVKRGGGVSVLFSDVTYETFYENLRELLDNYRLIKVKYTTGLGVWTTNFKYRSFEKLSSMFQAVVLAIDLCRRTGLYHARQVAVKTLNLYNYYKANMKRMSMVSKDKPMSAIDTAIWWVEYVIRHNGAPHLRPGSFKLGWYQYYMLDIAAILLTALVIICLMVYYSIRILTRILLSKNFKDKQKLKQS